MFVETSSGGIRRSLGPSGARSSTSPRPISSAFDQVPLDRRVGFLTDWHRSANLPRWRWRKLAPDNQARNQMPTLRMWTSGPDPGFVKAYGHIGYVASLKAIVHFYNMRDVIVANGSF